MAKKILMTLLAVLMCAGLLCACTSAPASSTPETTAANETAAPETEAAETEAPAVEGSSETKEIVLSDYFSQDVWEDDGGDVYVEEDHILFDNAFMGDFSALRMTETAQNVTYKFTLQLDEIPTDISVDEGTWWDAELLILGRSALAAPGWEEGQTGYCLTAWGDMSEVFIGRSGHELHSLRHSGDGTDASFDDYTFFKCYCLQSGTDFKGIVRNTLHRTGNGYCGKTGTSGKC